MLRSRLCGLCMNVGCGKCTSDGLLEILWREKEFPKKGTVVLTVNKPGNIHIRAGKCGAEVWPISPAWRPDWFGSWRMCCPTMWERVTAGLQRVWVGSGLVVLLRAIPCVVCSLCHPHTLLTSHTKCQGRLWLTVWAVSQGPVSTFGEKQYKVLLWKPKCAVAVTATGRRHLAWHAFPRQPLGDLKSLS